MKRLIAIVALTTLVVGCATATAPEVSDEAVRAAAKEIDYGDYTSETLAVGAWQALDEKNYPELLAYTQKCVELYGEEGKRMNDALTAFEPEATASTLWALNDVGTCLFIQANAYVALERYQDASASYRLLADEYNFAQCWDPKGWYWRPADGAALKAEKYSNW